MKNLRFTLVASATFGVASLVNAQLILSDGFDSYSTGNVDGKGAWFSSSGGFNVVPGGGNRPTATSPSQMLASATLNTKAGNFIQTNWNTRNSGNNILVAECDFYMPSSDTSGRSMNFGITGDTGNLLSDIGYSGSSFFIFSTQSGLTGSIAGARDTWHHLSIALNYSTKTTNLFADGSLLGSVGYGASENVNSIVLNSASGTGNFTEAYFDSFKATAVPEPMTFAVLGLGVVGFAMRRRNR